MSDTQHVVYTALSKTIENRAGEGGRATSIVGTGKSLYELLFPQDLYLSSDPWVDLRELWVIHNSQRFRIIEAASERPLTLHREGEMSLALSPDGRLALTAIPLDTVPPAWEALYEPPSPGITPHIRSGQQNVRDIQGQTLISEYALINTKNGRIEMRMHAPTGAWSGWQTTAATPRWSQNSRFVILPDTFDASGALNEPPAAPCLAIVDVTTNRKTCLERVSSKQDTKSAIITKAEFLDSIGSKVMVEHLHVSDQSRDKTTYARTSTGTWQAIRSDNAVGDRTDFSVTIKQGLNEPPRLIAINRTTNRSRIILDPNPQLQGVQFGKVTVFKWKDHSGRDWIGGLYLPPNYVAGRRYPLIIQNHGFRLDTFSPSGIFTTAFAAQELAASGIVVLQVQDSAYTVNPEEAPTQVMGYESAVTELAQQGLIDPHDVGIIGFSRTCYYVLTALTTSTVHFRAASITDGANAGYFQYLVNVNAFGDIIAHEDQSLIGAVPFGNGLQLWLQHSPDFRLNEITTPLQVVAVNRFSLLENWEPYAVLRYLHKPVDLIMLNNGTHILTDPAARLVSQGGTVDWFRFWLQGYEDPDPAKAIQYRRWEALRNLQ